MNISKVEISNYKQYSDEHVIPFPSSATVGIIGANGVGKTTLFEAIEWCLYNPSSIQARDIRPRGRSGYTSVVVTLEVPGTNEQFLVERKLKRNSTEATIRRVEEDGQEVIVVQGTKHVTDYVEKKLIGLSHTAFTATFFTRQKELSFFGHLGATERRRSVGKLLGLETIRGAQQIIANDRTRAINEARVLQNRYEAESKGRDFPKEIATAEATIESSREELARAHEAVDSASQALAGAEQFLLAQETLKDKDHAVAQRLLELRGERATASHQRGTIDEELGRLAARENERTVLLPVAHQADALRKQQEDLDDLRVTALRKREIEQSLLANQQRRRDTVDTLHSVVASLTPPGVLNGWAWRDADAADPCAACDRLLASIDGIDITASERRERDLQDCRKLAGDYAEAQATLRKYRERRNELDQRREQYLKDGDPAPRLETTIARIRELQTVEATLAARIGQLNAQHQQTSKLSMNLRQQQFDDVCPTCYRPFTNEDVAVALEVFQTQLESLDRERRRAEKEAAEIRREVTGLQEERQRLEESTRELARIDEGIEASGPYITEREQRVQVLSMDLDASLSSLGLSGVPADAEIMHASSELQAWRRILDARGGIERSHTTLLTLASELVTLDGRLKDIGDIDYDETAHRQVTRDYQDALKAQTTVAQIERDLERRPALEATLASCTQVMSTLDAAISIAEQERKTIGFDPANLDAAAQALREAREADGIAREMRHRVQATLREAEHTYDSLVKEQARISSLAIDADARQREHDRLDLMYREFTEFERFAAAWYAPRLSETTSELVNEVTDGKYDRVVFDNNFGIDVYDGEEEKFPLETFSGGERDVISLCARIALSRVIGGQGAHPPGFLVLDEVFGSLDRDRRTRMLEMLGTITTSGEPFRQIFIISHVDDVRTAPIFDELWQIVEADDGGSNIQNLPPGADIGEL